MMMLTGLTNARLADGRLADIRIADGRIAAIDAAAGAAPAPGQYDLGARLVLPGFIDGHVHLDKCLLGLPWQPHRPGGSVADRIVIEKALLSTLSVSVEERAQTLIAQLSRHGTTSLRSHVDIDTDWGLSNLQAIMQVRDAMRDIMDIQIVAFPQNGILRDPGTAALLDAAVSEGADLIGGLDPAGIDGDIGGHLDVVFGIAERRGVGVDIHLHDGGALGCFELRAIAARTIAAGLQGRVAVSHAFALGYGDDADVGVTIDALARAEIAIMTNEPGRVSMPPVQRLRAAGVAVFVGSDNIRDAWSPYGNGDLLERAMLVGYRQGMMSDAALCDAVSLVTTAPARVLGLGADYGLDVGGWADIVAVQAGSMPEALVSRPAGRLVIKRGRMVSQG